MKKNKIITSVVVMALCSFAIAYAANKSGIIVFILSYYNIFMVNIPYSQ